MIIAETVHQPDDDDVLQVKTIRNTHNNNTGSLSKTRFRVHVCYGDDNCYVTYVRVTVLFLALGFDFGVGLGWGVGVS